MAALIPRHAEIERFLTEDLAEAILAHAIAHEADFVPSQVVRAGHQAADATDRQSLRLPAGLGPHAAAFREAVLARLGDLCAASGLAPFEAADCELELAAHGDGAFYRPHVDTRTDAAAREEGLVRTLTLVWYAHRRPAGFTGGELAIYPFGGSEQPCAAITPHHNLLVAFASIVPHSVEPVACPSGRFTDYRFAVNCWVRRRRSG